MYGIQSDTRSKDFTRNVTIDVHHHIGGLGALLPALERKGAPRRNPDTTADQLERVSYLEGIGADHCVVMPSFEYPTRRGPLDIQKTNDEIVEYSSKSDFVFAAMGIVDPLTMDVGQAVTESRRLSELGIKGLAFHNRFQRVPINSPIMKEIIHGARDHFHVFAVHCVAESQLEAPWRLLDLAQTFPDVSFLSLSSLSGFSQCQEMTFLMGRSTNIYVDTAAMLSFGGWIERIVGEVGIERMLFGTDLYLDPHPRFDTAALNSVLGADISEEDRIAILDRNARRMFS